MKYSYIPGTSIRAHKKRDNLEDKEQAALFEWAACYPVLRWMHAIPNGVFLHGNKIQRAKQMARLKKQGLKPGVLDIFLPLVIPPYHGLYIEMKRSDGKGMLSDNQVDFFAHAESQGYKTVVCEGTEAAIKVIKEYARIK